MYKINGHYVYLTDQQYQEIFDKVAGNETAQWKISSSIIGHKENIEKHKRIKKYLENNFRREYYRFDFYGKEAQDNIVDILSSYAELTDTIRIFRADEISPAEAWEETVTGYKIKRVKIKIYEKIFFGLFGKKDTGNSITIDTRNVEHICGELMDFISENNEFIMRFTKDNVNLTYK